MSCVAGRSLVNHHLYKSMSASVESSLLVASLKVGLS